MMNEKEMKQREKEDKYDIFESQIIKNFEELVGKNTPLFKTDVDDLWELYLQNLPYDARQHYNCNACRHFIERFGDLVTINEKGKIQSVIWGFEAPDFFRKSVWKMIERVEKARIRKVFISDERTLGTPTTGIWTHMHVVLPVGKTNTSRLKTAGQVMADKLEDYRMLSRANEKYSMSTLNTALELLNSETLYRGDKCLGVAKWFKELKEILEGCNNSRDKENLKWLAVATAPNGFTHISSSMIGTLLDDIQDGLGYDAVSRRFAEKMNPNNYMRSQSAPTEGAIRQAEKVVEDLGIAESLERRYATIDEIPEFIWKRKDIVKKAEVKKGSIFGDLTPKGKEIVSKPEMNLPVTTMTWDKFKRTLLPTATGIEVKVDNPNRLMALVTALHPESENILQWNNPYSWYYHGGIDAEMKRRVESAGGRHEDNEIRCSLMWEGRTDLDLHCITPNGFHICWSDKKDRRGGWLDLDMNGIDLQSVTPVENMRWADNAPEGRYKFYVYNFNERENHNGTPFKAELEINGQVFSFVGSPLRNKYKVTVFEFDYIDGQVRMISNVDSAGSSSSDWNIPTNEFVKVNGITSSPNLWNNEGSNSGNHVFFLIDGCKDLSEGKGRGFFNEMLKPELREIRKTLEAYMAQAPIEGVDNASACGVGYSKDNEWNLIVKVTSGSSTRLVKIDRWD